MAQRVSGWCVAVVAVLGLCAYLALTFPWKPLSSSSTGRWNEERQCVENSVESPGSPCPSDPVRVKSSAKKEQREKGRTALNSSFTWTNEVQKSRGNAKPQLQAGRPSLVLFTTWSWNPEKVAVESNVLATWPRWRPHVQPLLFSNNETTRERALRHGWLTLHVPRVSCGNLPVLSAMFQAAIDHYESFFYGFANADLLFDESLNSSIHIIRQNENHLYDLNNVMILSKRINVNWPEGFIINTTSQIREYAVKGRNPREGSSDFFVTTRSFPWEDVPDLVVGRIGFGMWVVAFARARRAQCIDITRTCRLVHMTTASGIHESQHKPNKMCNHRTIKASHMTTNFYCGWIDCAHFITVGGKAGKVTVVQNDVPKSLCLPCELENLT